MLALLIRDEEVFAVANNILICIRGERDRYYRCASVGCIEIKLSVHLLVDECAFGGIFIFIVV